MKKHLSIALLGLATFAFSQCNITGKSSIIVGEKENYSIENDNAQCPDCHLWVTLGKNLLTESDNKKNSVSLKAASGGRAILSLSILTPAGISQCSKNIDIVDTATGNPAANSIPNSSVSNNSAPKNSDCDISVTDYKEVKYADGIVSFFPNGTGNFNYTWLITYSNQEAKESTEKIPQFSYSKDNGINSVKVKVSSKKCIKTFTKNYDANFWKYF